MLGRAALGRIRAHQQQLGTHEPLAGRWITLSTAGHALQLRSGSVPIAELTDLDGDGRVDLVLVYLGH